MPLKIVTVNDNLFQLLGDFVPQHGRIQRGPSRRPPPLNPADIGVMSNELKLCKPSSIQGGPKKTAPIFSCNNFGKYAPILIMFSLQHSQMN